MTNPYAKLEAAIKDAIYQMKKDLAHCDVPYISFLAHVHGRVDGDIDVSFSLGHSHEPDYAKSGDLTAVINEYVRRRAWNHRNAPLCLPNVAEPINTTEEREESLGEHLADH